MSHRPLVAWLSCSLALLACGDESVAPQGNDGGSGGSDASSNGGSGAGTVDPVGGSGGSGGALVEPTFVATMSGDVTWNVTFDATAQAAGAVDCSYTRHYEAVEDQSAKWLCPACEVMFYADVEMTAGQADCFSQISSTDPFPNEWIGYGGGVWYRGLGGPMTDQGTVMMDGSDVTTQNMVADNMFPAGGLFSFTIAGNLTLGEDEGDPLNGFNVPDVYECGWPKSNAPPYTGDYTIVEDEIVPDGLFKDRCGEAVRLHDFGGRYLVIDMAARDCPPCQAMAGDEADFLAEMAAAGIEVEVVTLLANSLSDTLTPATPAQMNTWTNNYDLTSPVLGDRGWGLSQFIPIFGETVGYPSMVVVRPDLTVMFTSGGYAGFAEIETAILADAGQ